MTVVIATVTPNPRRRPGCSLPRADQRVTAFHRRLPGYAPTALHEVPALAEAAGVGAVLVKDDSERFGLPAFKMLGASWAGYRALLDRLGNDGTAGTEPAWSSLADLADVFDPLRPLDLATATDGNHGRAVARFAAWLGFGARIFVPAGTSAARIAAIESEGAVCTVVDGTYDDAVARAAEEAGDDCLVLSDTSWEGYEELPRHVIAGYRTIFSEVDEHIGVNGLPYPTAVMVPVGVGALAAAAAQWYRPGAGGHDVKLIGVEPDTADCVGASLRAGRLVEVPGPHRSIMAGLNCGLASPVAWPLVAPAFDAMVAVDDDVSVAGMRALAAAGIVSGESGAACAGALVTARSAALGLGPDDVVLVVSTEGATDPAAWEAAVGRSLPR
jgi:diaminopropionate ammonia-lyase